MRRNIGRSVPMAAIACALTVGSLGACSADTGTGAGDGSTGAGASRGSAAQTSAAPVTAPPTSVTVDTTDVATDPPRTNRTPAPAGRPGQPQEVTVTTTYAGVLAGGSAVEAGGYVDVLEPDGTCTLTLTRGATTRTVSAAVTPDGTTASCGGLAVALSELEAGTWQAVLSYASSGAAGTAPGVDVVVP